MVMKKLEGFGRGLLNRKTSSETTSTDSGDSPEATAARGVRLFCESAGPNNAGEEVLHLPTIVDAAESSPTAAAAAAKQIRKFLSKENYSKPYIQYNAIMLIRILCDNPGQSFTRNIDDQFVKTVKDLLRQGRDPSVQQIVRESLAALYAEKGYDTNLAPLFQMWSKEQGSRRHPMGPPGPRTLNAPPFGAHQGQGNMGSQQPREQFARNGRIPTGLPPPEEMAARIEEARTTAKLLLQLVQSTPHNELLGNDLVKEFADRCQTAQRSLQVFINCDNPPPDDDTLQTLIETNEQLSLAASKHQRAVLTARRANPSPSPSASASQQQPPEIAGARPPPGPPPSQQQQQPKQNAYQSPAPTSTAPYAGGPPQLPAILPDTSSSPPPPPATMRANLQRRQSQLESSNQPSEPPAELPAQTAPSGRSHGRTDSFPNYYSNDPFGDDHEEDNYAAPSPHAASAPRPLSAGRKPVAGAGGSGRIDTVMSGGSGARKQTQTPPTSTPMGGHGADFGDGGSPVSPVESRYGRY